MRMGRHQGIYRIIGATRSVVCLRRRKVSAVAAAVVVVAPVGNVAVVAAIIVVVWPSLLWRWRIGGGHTWWTVPYT